jgi:hypothetical protein
MTQTEAIALARECGRSLGGASIADAIVLRAIQAIGDVFVRIARVPVTTSDVTVTAATAAVSLTGLTGFRPEFLLRCWIGDGDDLDRVDHSAMRERRRTDAETGTPDSIAFLTWTGAEVYPTPTANATLKVQWVPPFTISAESCNVPDDLLRNAIRHGAPVALQMTDPDQLWTDKKGAEFRAWCETCRSAGTMGANVCIRRPLRR